MKKITRISVLTHGAALGAVLALASQFAVAGTAAPARLAETKDILIPDWGPFSKQFAGISHVLGGGDRFDLSVMVALSGKKPVAPDVLTATGFHPWEAGGDYRYYRYRIPLEGDRLFADVSFVPHGENARLVKVEFTNRHEESRSVDLHSLACLFPEPVRAQSPRLVTTPGTWIGASEYAEIRFGKTWPDAHLVKDGLKPGEVVSSAWIGARALGGKWGRSADDFVRYEVVLEKDFSDAVVWIRYGNKGAVAARLQMSGLADGIVDLPPASSPSEVLVPVGKLRAGKGMLSLRVLTESNVELDGVLVLEKAEVDRISLESGRRADVPRIKNKGQSGIVLNYADRGRLYGLTWDRPVSRARMISGKNATESYVREMTASTRKRFLGRGLLRDENELNYVVNTMVVDIPAKMSVSAFGLVCTGNEAEIGAEMGAFARGSDFESLWRAAREQSLSARPVLPSAKPYLHGERLMRATTLMNIVYPERIDGQWIKHYTPGKRWNSLYTWDSGFVGIGLASIVRDRAIENLNTYVNGPGHHSAFIHHGTPLPIQMYQFMEIWNRGPEPELLRYFYPRLKRFYRFYAGRAEGSTTGNLQSGLLRTWDYFYNSGGWDDYPPQRFVIRKKMRDSVAPVVSTATALRVAKILRTLAEISGNQGDIAEYDRDIAAFTGALQTHAWDAESGYYSYVTHDADGRPTGILRDETGVNFNQGLDGLYPLVAGICTPGQRAKLLERMFDPKRIWTPYGLSTVDQGAPYYNPNGYWNGAVWFPHQWVFWKALLDMGEAELAFRIASTGLGNWRRLAMETNNCYEHINIKDGKGDGCPQFSGLSTPVLNWFDAYYRVGSISGGFDMVVTRRAFSKSHDALDAELTFGPPVANTRSVIVTLAPGRDYEARWNGGVVPIKSPHDGCLWITIPGGPAAKGQLTISAKQ